MAFPNFVLLVLLNASQEVLLLRRINTPFCNECYCLPGIAIELGQSARSAVRREAQKSLGVMATYENIQHVHTMYRKCNEPEFFSCLFQVTKWEGVPTLMQPDRYDDLQWFALDALPSMMVPAHRYGLEQLQAGVVYSEHGWDAIKEG